MKWAKFFLAILLLPVCYGVAQALWLVIVASKGADGVWVATLAGVACWLVIFFLLPKPMWLYVMGHELTHAVWAWMFGGRVKRFRASSKGGQVLLTKTNFVIALAPYFFPFYAAVVVGLFALGHFVWNWERYAAWFHLLLGAAYAFHVTLTWHILRMRQTDITDHGYLFSAVVIFLGNAIVLLIAVPLLGAQVELGTALGWWVESTTGVMRGLGGRF
jgi:hypothetical protein